MQKAAPFSSPAPRRLSAIAATALLPLLGGCNMVVLNPAGDVAQQQGNLVIISTLLMLIIILPVMALTLFFAWKYRESNGQATYKPDWDHSTSLELVIWSAPLLIIICLGALTWVGTHLLDPYRPIARIAPNRPVTTAERTLDVQVVALDWKWLFIYPEYGVASVNELVLPVDRPVRFRISASSVMNSFYVPALAGQIYAMPGMETRLHAVLNNPGDYVGFSANYSGAGFSGMRFRTRGVDQAGFDGWIAAARSSSERLDREAYLALERPSENVPVRHFVANDPQLFDAVVNMCVEPGRMCMHDIMMIDRAGGLGLASARMGPQLDYDKYVRRGGRPYDVQMARAAPMCVAPRGSVERADMASIDPAPLLGMGLSRGRPTTPATIFTADRTAGSAIPAS